MSQEKTSPPDVEVVRWFTRARKFPQLIGRTPDGTRLWGGPYTPTQLVGGGLVFFIGARTLEAWANFGLVMNLALLLVISYGTIWGLGRVPIGARNPLSILTGIYRAVMAPQTGHLAGRPVRLRRPYRVQHRVSLPLADLPEPAAPAVAGQSKPAPAASPTTAQPTRTQPTPAPGPTRKPALTGVQALLATKANATNTQETD